MISRLTAYAIAFACVATTTIGWAASNRQIESRSTGATHMTRDALPIVRLDTVVIIGHRATVGLD